MEMEGTLRSYISPSARIVPLLQLMSCEVSKVMHVFTSCRRIPGPPAALVGFANCISFSHCSGPHSARAVAFSVCPVGCLFSPAMLGGWVPLCAFPLVVRAVNTPQAVVGSEQLEPVATVGTGHPHFLIL